MSDQQVETNAAKLAELSAAAWGPARPALLFVTDRPNHAHEVTRDLGLIAAVHLASLHSAPNPAEFAGLVSDVDLRNHAEVMVMRELVCRATLSRRRVLCLLREDTEHERVQARFLGCAAILPAKASRELRLHAARQLLQPDPADPHRDTAHDPCVVGGIRETAVLLAGLLDPSCHAGSLRLAAVQEGADTVYEAIRADGLRNWLDIVWEYDDATYQHCLLVAGLAGAFAHGLGFAPRDRQRLIGGALIHDIGKAQIPLSILNKPGRLTDDERAVMRRHPVIGYELLQGQCRAANPVDPDHLAIVRHHHEYLDGTGYPDGLRAQEIPDIVRLITICDIYAALIERRPYKARIAETTALSILQDMATKLDPDLFGAFGRIVSRDLPH